MSSPMTWPGAVAIAAVAIAAASFVWAAAWSGVPSAVDHELVIAPPCDTRANAVDAAEQLRARIAAGVADTECDLQQLDHLEWLAGEWARDRNLVHDLELELTECSWGWLIDDRDYLDHVEGTRLEAAIDLLMECAEASR